MWVEVEYETVNMFNLFCSFFAQIVEKDDKYIDAYRRFLPEKELSLNTINSYIKSIEDENRALGLIDEREEIGNE